MYKDPEKAKEAARERQRRYKARQKALPKGVTSEGVTTGKRQGVTIGVSADKYPSLTVMERLFYRPAHKLKPGEHNFVSLPGRACYKVFGKGVAL